MSQKRGVANVMWNTSRKIIRGIEIAINLFWTVMYSFDSIAEFTEDLIRSNWLFCFSTNGLSKWFGNLKMPGGIRLRALRLLH